MKYFILIVTFLGFKTCNSFTSPNILTDRRTVVASSLISPISQFNFNNFNIKKPEVEKNIDYYAKWNAYGLVPPPIEKTVSKEELTDLINVGNIISLQIAPQHDCVIATTIKNHRITCFIKDKDFNDFIQEFKDKDNNLPFRVLPIDKNRQNFRTFAQIFFATYLVRFFKYRAPKYFETLDSLNEKNHNITINQKIMYLLNSTFSE